MIAVKNDVASVVDIEASKVEGPYKKCKNHCSCVCFGQEDSEGWTARNEAFLEAVSKNTRSSPCPW